MAAKIKTQKGFATIEIILILLIISILASSAIPKISRSLDIAQLNYEIERFISEFYFAKSASKNSGFNPTIFSSNFTAANDVGKNIKFIVETENYQTNYNRDLIRDIHKLPPNFKISRPNNLHTIIFSQGKRDGVSGTYTFTSAQNKSWYINLDSTGRDRASRNKN